MQSNHRSWADFYLDVVATDGNAQMLSRMAVALVFPMFMGAVCVIRSVILFQRGRKHDKEVRSETYTAMMCQQGFHDKFLHRMRTLSHDGGAHEISACAELQQNDRQKDGSQPCRRSHRLSRRSVSCLLGQSQTATNRMHLMRSPLSETVLLQVTEAPREHHCH